MNVKKIDHIAIVVRDLEEALHSYESALGLTATQIEYVEDFKVKVVFLPIGDTQLELIQPVGDEEVLTSFLKKNGGGLHHIALRVDNIHSAIDSMTTNNIKMKDSIPQKGASNSKVAFVDKNEFSKVTIEFVEKK